jgi:hypothetical protein
MDKSIRTAAIRPLRQWLIDDMIMLRFSRETQRNYARDGGALKRSWSGSRRRRYCSRCLRLASGSTQVDGLAD